MQRIDEDPFEFLNSWIWDRSRAVRKDFVSTDRKRQDTEPYAGCLELCIRYHLLSMQQMAEREGYERQPEEEQLSASYADLMRLWQNCNVYKTSASGNSNEGHAPTAPQQLTTAHAAEFEAYLIILSIRWGNRSRGSHYEIVRRHPRVKAAETLVRAATETRDFAKFWSIIASSQVSYLMACAAAVSFNDIRKETLETLRRAYRSAGTTDDWTLPKLIQVLGFDNEEQVILFCSSYGGKFETNAAGVTYLNPDSLTANATDGRLVEKKDSELPIQFYSEIVESKRYGRKLSAILFGMTFAEAKKQNLLEGDDSLFVPEKSAKSNPFAIAAATAPSGGLSGFAPAAVKPGLFNANTDTIKFSNDAVPQTSKANPFAKAAAGLSTQATTATPVTASPFLSPFQAPSAPTTNGQTAAPSLGFSFLQPKSDTQPATPSTGFSFAQPSQPPASAAIPASGLSFTPPSQPSEPARTEEEKRREAEEAERKAKAEVQRKIQEEAQRKAQEEAQKKAREEEERKAKEAAQRAAAEQQRKYQEEQQAKARAAEQQRLLQIENERRAQEEMRRAQEEAVRRAEQRRIQSMNTLAENVLMDPKNGLWKHFLEHVVGQMIEDTRSALEVEVQADNDRIADERYQQRRLAFARAVFYRWVQQVAKKKKLADGRQFRQRRQKLKAQIQAARASATPDVQPVQAAANGPLHVNHANGDSHSNTMIEAQVESQHEVVQDEHHTSAAPRRNDIVSRPKHDYSKSYYENRAHSEALRKSQAPVDRTETDWFTLRSMGIDPSKNRKRTFDSVSSEDEEQPKVEHKRVRSGTVETLPSNSALRQSLPPPSSDEERMARFRVIKESLNKSRNTSNPLSRSFDSSRGGFGNDIIARARQSLAMAPPSRQSTPDVGGFGRSTGTPPSTERPAYWARQSRFVPAHLYGQPEAIRAYRAQITGRSPAPLEKVPHIPRKQSPDPPHFLSSPISTQQSYYPSGNAKQLFDMQPEHLIEDDADGEEDEVLIDFEDSGGEGEGEEDDEVDEEEDSDIGEEEDDELDEEEEVMDEDEAGNYYSDEEGYSDEDEQNQQFAQQAGATENDAIELSD